MAYSTSSPPIKVSEGIDSVNLWLYQSADAAATVKAANYITNAKDLGMKVGDGIIILDTNTPLSTLAIVSAVASTGSTLT
jgi:hypothetical protein